MYKLNIFHTVLVQFPDNVLNIFHTVSVPFPDNAAYIKYIARTIFHFKEERKAQSNEIHQLDDIPLH